MSKLRPGFDNKQSSIFEILRGLSTPKNQPTPEGQLNLIERLRVALRDAIKSCPLSRHQIAGEMSHLVGHTITKEMIDSWTRGDQSETGSDGPVGSDVSDYKTIRRHVPAEYLPAFCKVTGSHEPLRLLCEAAGFFVLPGPEALRAEIQRIEEQIRDGQDRKRKRVMFLKEMEKEK
jgi:hypothetical protein